MDKIEGIYVNSDLEAGIVCIHIETASGPPVNVHLTIAEAQLLIDRLIICMGI